MPAWQESGISWASRPTTLQPGRLLTVGVQLLEIDIAAVLICCEKDTPDIKELLLLCAAANNIDGLDALSLGYDDELAPKHRPSSSLEQPAALGDSCHVHQAKSCQWVHLHATRCRVNITFTAKCPLTATTEEALEMPSLMLKKSYWCWQAEGKT